MQRALHLMVNKQAAVRHSVSIRKFQQNPSAGMLLSNSAALTEICHDLKTPIQTIRGALQLLSMSINNGQSSTRSARYINMLDGSSQHLLRMVSNLVDQLRLETGALSSYPICLDLAAHLRLLTDLSQSYAEFAGVTLSAEGLDNERPVMMDVDKLDKILLNLLSNALKYVPQGGHVCLRLNCGKRRLTLSVQDDGHGIAPERMANLFRSPADLEPDGLGGARMGLILSQELSELLGGQLSVQNLPKGGFCAQLVLPYLPSENQPSDSVPSESDLIAQLRTELSPVFLRSK